jgi:hypothetical protein
MCGQLMLVGGGRMRVLLPNQYVPSIYDIDLEELKYRGIKGIITDLDNTLIEWNSLEASLDLADWLKHVEESGFQLMVVSNNQEERVRRFCQPLGIPFIHRARKPLRFSFKKAQKMMGLHHDEIVVIGDQLLTDVLGGNRLGYYTILVVPLVETDGFFTRFNRKMERLIFYWMKKRGIVVWKEK